jgi:GNAT superfamily N-acetyltransferase
MSYRIEAATEPTSEVEHALASLLPQLNPALAGPTHYQLKALITDPASTLLLVIDGGAIIGTATVVVYTTPAWVKARIEDVVVDERVRGRGIGEALVNECIEVARKRGASIVELQSARHREVANRLYPRMGFQLRDTNVYRITID